MALMELKRLRISSMRRGGQVVRRQIREPVESLLRAFPQRIFRRSEGAHGIAQAQGGERIDAVILEGRHAMLPFRVKLGKYLLRSTLRL